MHRRLLAGRLGINLDEQKATKVTKNPRVPFHLSLLSSPFLGGEVNALSTQAYGQVNANRAARTRSAGGDTNMTAQTAASETTHANRIRGATLRYTWTEGPTKGATHEHIFNDDGSVVWRCVSGPQKGHSGREKDYAAMKIADGAYLVSYLASSGYTLTVALNFQDNTMVGIASGKDWFPCKGTFEVINREQH
jgi:hypothetical protein